MPRVTKRYLPVSTDDALAEFNALVECGEPGSVAAYVERLVAQVQELEAEKQQMVHQWSDLLDRKKDLEREVARLKEKQRK